MAGAKVVVLYPYPRDVEKFERLYVQDHAPMVTPQTFPGLQRFVASKVQSAADGGRAPFYRIAELHFPSLAALQAATGTEAAQRAVAHAIEISNGGPPVFMVAEEEGRTF